MRSVDFRRRRKSRTQERDLLTRRLEKHLPLEIRPEKLSRILGRRLHGTNKPWSSVQKYCAEPGPLRDEEACTRLDNQGELVNKPTHSADAGSTEGIPSSNSVLPTNSPAALQHTSIADDEIDEPF